jgi:hypothetical protein
MYACMYVCMYVCMYACIYVYVKTGWWYTPAEEMRCKRCKGCDQVQAQDAFTFDEWKKVTGSKCRKCKAQPERPRKRVTREGERKSVRQRAKVHYGEKGESDDEMDETEDSREEAGVRCEAADPRYIGRADDRDRGDIVLRGRDVRDVLQWDVNPLAHGGQTMKIETQVWLTTRQMGHALKWEDTELTQERDERLGKQTARYLAPAISSFISKKFREEPDGMGQDDEAREVAEEAWLLDQVWGKWGEGEVTDDLNEVGEERGDGEEDDIRSHVKVWAHGRKQKWEPASGVGPGAKYQIMISRWRLEEIFFWMTCQRGRGAKGTCLWRSHRLCGKKGRGWG